MSQLPAVRNGILTSPLSDAPIAVATPEWFAWLRAARSFSYAGATGTFTARHEERSGRQFWYAYRQSGGKLRKHYLGRSADLTLPRLEQAARALTTTARAQPQVATFDGLEEWVAPLIATKIVVPQPGPSLIARPSLIAHCLDCLDRPCAILSAPAGSGKTTLLITASDRLKDRGWQVAWVSLEETEQDPVRFWTYVLAALDGACPGSTAAAQRMLATPRPMPIENVLTTLINALAATTSPVMLVLDDYHRAATPASDAGLVFLIDHAPATLHLAISTRTEPAFALAGLRARGRIAELHAADMRFTKDDARRFLRETMHLSLSDDRLAQLDERTEGWVAGLQLAALSLREQTDIREPVADLSPTPRYIADYLIAEVLEHQPEDVQAFLLRTAPLERLTGPLCDAVTGRSDSAEMLARLMHAQLFVTPLDAGQTWYRYHQLFADVLRERLRRTAPDVWEHSHRRAAKWLREHGMTEEAIRHLLIAQAFGEAATLIEAEGERLVIRGETAGLSGWARELPRQVILSHPHLSVLLAATLMLQGNTTDAGTLLDDLDQSLPPTGPFSDAARGESAAVRAIVLLMNGEFAEGAALGREALKRLPPESHFLRGLALWLINVVGLLGDDDLSDVVDTIARMARDSHRDGNLLVAFMALATQAGIELYQGRLHRAERTCREALRLISRPSGEELPLTAMAYSLLGEIRREWNDLEGAESDLRHALEVGLHLGSAEFVDDGLISLALVQAETDRYDESMATLEKMYQLVQIRQFPTWDEDMADLTRARVLVRSGQLDEAVRWADERWRHREKRRLFSSLVLFREMEDLALVRVELARGNASAAVKVLDDLCVRASRAGRMRNVLEARMLQARAHALLGESDAALRALDASLALAAPEDFRRVFLDEGEPMADLLASYVAHRPHSPERTHALRLLTAFGRVVGILSQPPADALSARELDVLRLLATGRSNAAIADELIIAPSTVKWHVAQIYRKLGVTGRVQALSRARELRLLV